MNPTEKAFQEQIVEALGFCSWHVLEYGKSGGHGPLRGAVPPGHADLLAVKDGRHVFLELKMPRGRLSQAQVTFRDYVQAAGSEWYAIRSLEDLKEALGLESLRIQGGQVTFDVTNYLDSEGNIVTGTEDFEGGA